MSGGEYQKVGLLSWCTNTGITQAGDCSFTANLSNGIAPLQVKFEVTRSDVAGITDYGYGPATRTINVPAGDYTLIVKATPREQGYLRVGYSTIQEIPVCTEDQFMASGGDNMKATTCGGEGGEN